MKRIHGCLLTLENPIDFDSVDDQPVDLIFALIVPEEKNDEHLATLARVAALMQKVLLDSYCVNVKIVRICITRP